jgi:hypothetical protein
MVRTRKKPKKNQGKKKKKKKVELRKEKKKKKKKTSNEKKKKKEWTTKKNSFRRFRDVNRNYHIPSCSKFNVSYYILIDVEVLCGKFFRNASSTFFKEKFLLAATSSKVFKNHSR